jgi:cytochrome c553
MGIYARSLGIFRHWNCRIPRRNQPLHRLMFCVAEKRWCCAGKLPACAACHGLPLTGVTPAIPGLLGLPSAYLSAQLGAWRAGQRQAHAPDCMAVVAKALSPEDVSAVAAWLSAQPVPTPAKPIEKLDAPLPLQCGGVPQ